MMAPYAGLYGLLGVPHPFGNGQPGDYAAAAGVSGSGSGGGNDVILYPPK